MTHRCNLKHRPSYVVRFMPHAVHHDLAADIIAQREHVPAASHTLRLLSGASTSARARGSTRR